LRPADLRAVPFLPRRPRAQCACAAWAFCSRGELRDCLGGRPAARFRCARRRAGGAGGPALSSLGRISPCATVLIVFVSSPPVSAARVGTGQFVTFEPLTVWIGRFVRLAALGLVAAVLAGCNLFGQAKIK